ncbi:LysR family transcriptional regulator [Sphingomonas sinipercae]|uniref:LysR family transcriptional regulator n=1 Tax=Sphingomonas sinipercae TaxID=2714944 RepID=A0A6G7ZN18_9SPHN|nr:LysR family transcriptional regulator [Sphingomonas sinipercae]QIL02333.1 LysR family transcriptional regulator [Sphingomonas sinipercae]
MLDWNDLRFFLAVADSGSTLSAARNLRVSQTTVARRIGALEQALGLTLFDRRQAGYTLTPDGERLIGHARSVGASVDALGDAAAAQVRDTSGTVRLTTEEIFAVQLLPPLLRALHDAHPEIVIEMDATSEVRDLGAGEADIALRATRLEQSAGVVGRRLCVDDWAFYCTPEYGERNGIPGAPEQLRGHALIGGGGGNLWREYQSYLRRLGVESQVAIHQATSSGLLAAVRSGVGIAVLPCLVADSDPELVQCFGPRSGHGRVMWLLTHERVRHSPRVRVVTDFLFERIRQRVADLNLST